MPIGKAAIHREGTDITLAGVGITVHRALESAEIVQQKGISAEVIDRRTVAPLDTNVLLASVSKTGRLLAVDEDYRDFGLSGELAARVLESGIPAKFAMVYKEDTPTAVNWRTAYCPGPIE
ncbi:MAG: hypothetical protein GY850_09215 [bacterium]|nr:hypothetical protein [bacterium]